jgi:AcrR family transcriptional regulator
VTRGRLNVDGEHIDTIKPKGNIVNMNRNRSGAVDANSTTAAARSTRGYHHGDLRAALLGEGLRRLEVLGNPGDISLRELARNVGVSATAVYRHFPDKAALLSALAVHGLNELAEVQQAAARATAPGSSEFAEIGRAYVRFALARPGLYRLIFTHAMAGPQTLPLTEEPCESPAVLLRSMVARSLGGRASEAQVQVVALRAWSLVHGLAMLLLDRQLPQELAEVTIENVINATAVGLD